MFDCFLAQSLVLVLLFFCSVRIFFLKHSRIDCFAAFSPAALIISLFTLFCFGFSVINLGIFTLSLLVFFTNFRSILRLSAKLIVDSYSPIFIIFSTIFLVCTIVLAVFVIYFRPIKYNIKDFNASRTEYTLTGNLSNLRIRQSPFSGEKFSGSLFIYEPVSNDEITNKFYSENPVLIFSPGIRASVINYEPYFLLLAQKGYKIIAADIYTDELNLLAKSMDDSFKKTILGSKFFRRFAALHYEKRLAEKAENIFLAEQNYATKKYSALTKLALEIFGDETKIFYVVDGVDFDSIYSVIDEFNTEPYSNAKGFFSMNRVDEYKTSGYGFIEQTDVLLAHTKDIERENKFFIPRYVANKTIKAIEEQKQEQK